MRASLVALVLAATPVAADPGFQHISTFIWDRPEDYFGGWSAIEVAEDGTGFVVIGDNAQVFQGEFVRDGEKIVEVVWAPIGALSDTDGVAFFRKETEHIGDSEGIAALSNGQFAVSFERFPRIIVYDGETAVSRIELPREAASLSENGGVEALAVDSEQNLIAIPETIPRGSPGFPVWRQTSTGWETLGHISRTQGFRPVGADVGPDGLLYVLERAFHLIGFQSRIRTFDPQDFDRDGELLWTAPLRAFDNLEGISVWLGADKSMRITLISDDNHLALQETQIVEFRLTQ